MSNKWNYKEDFKLELIAESSQYVRDSLHRTCGYELVNEISQDITRDHVLEAIVKSSLERIKHD